MGASSATTMQYQATSTAQAHARTLRQAMTDSERRLWSRLRLQQLGVKFRRQHPIGPYIVDFACLSPRLAVELDGSQHAKQADADARRDAYLNTQGFFVLRFPSDAPLRNINGVLQAIVNWLAGSPHPSLPPEGEGA